MIYNQLKKINEALIKNKEIKDFSCSGVFKGKRRGLYFELDEIDNLSIKYSNENVETKIDLKELENLSFKDLDLGGFNFLEGLDYISENMKDVVRLLNALTGSDYANRFEILKTNPVINPLGITQPFDQRNPLGQKPPYISETKIPDPSIHIRYWEK